MVYSDDDFSRMDEMKADGFTWREMGEAFGSSKESVRKAYGRRKKGVYRRKLGAAKQKSSKPQEVKEKVDNSWFFDENYVYDREADRYITFVPGLPKPLDITGDMHRAMKRAYSDWDGSPETINQICRDYGISRSTFTGYKRIHGWTHDSDPFTNEELMERDVGDLVDEALQAKKQSLFRSFEKASWRQTRQSADKWDRFESSILLPLTTMDGSPITIDPATKDGGSIMAVWSLFADLHYGKYGWHHEVGQTYDRAKARERVVQSISKVLPMLPDDVSQLVLITGSDDEHIDNSIGTTTGGTPQDMDGTPAQIVYEYGEFLAAVVSKLREMLKIPIVIVNIPGNHNRHTAILRGQFLRAYFRDFPDIHVLNIARTREYINFGVNLIGLCHGDSAKLSKLPMIMAGEKKELWGSCTSRVWITNHRHQETELMPNGAVRVFITPALSGCDRWHYRKGYVAAPAASAVYLFDKKDGFSGMIYKKVD